MYKSAFAKTQKSALKQLHQLLDLYRDVDLTEECRMTLGEWMDKWFDEYMIFPKDTEASAVQEDPLPRSAPYLCNHGA